MTYVYTFYPNTGYRETDSEMLKIRKMTKAHEANLKFKRFLDANKLVFPMDYIPISVTILFKEYTQSVDDAIIICLFNDKMSYYRSIQSNQTFMHLSSVEALRFHNLPTTKKHMKVVEYAEKLSEDGFHLI